MYFKYPDPDSSGAVRAPACVVPAYGYVLRERGKAADVTVSHGEGADDEESLVCVCVCCSAQ